MTNKTGTESVGDFDAGVPLSKTAYVFNRLKDEIAQGTLIPGESLRQSEIADRLGVSPTPVREALRLLEAEGAIRYTPNRGASVREMSPEDADDTYLLRAQVEALATELAVERMTGPALDRIISIHRELHNYESANSGTEAALLNRQLHFAIYEQSSRVICNTIESLWSLFPPRVTIWGNKSIAQQLVNEHDHIIEAISSKHAKLAGQLMSAHILSAATTRREYERQHLSAIPEVVADVMPYLENADGE